MVRRERLAENTTPTKPPEKAYLEKIPF